MILCLSALLLDVNSTPHTLRTVSILLMFTMFCNTCFVLYFFPKHRLLLFALCAMKFMSFVRAIERSAFLIDIF